jgi:NAD(P)H-flavin reductase
MPVGQHSTRVLALRIFACLPNYALVRKRLLRRHVSVSFASRVETSSTYSIASLPEHELLELHVAVREGGAMSGWLRGATGRTVQLRGPFGECFYQHGQLDQPLLLAGTGTGMAPLWGVLQSALQSGHRAPVHVYHSSLSASGLYMLDALRELAQRHSSVRVHALVANNDNALPGLRTERLDAAIASDLPVLTGYRVYLCGNPEQVQRLKKKAFVAGAKLQEIHSDSFVERAF